MPETPSMVELLERLVALEKAVAARNARIEALEAENAALMDRFTGFRTDFGIMGWT